MEKTMLYRMYVPNPEYSDYLPKVEPPPPPRYPSTSERRPVRDRNSSPAQNQDSTAHGEYGASSTYMANTPRCLYNLGMYQGQNIERPPGVIPPLMAWKPQPQARHRIGLVKSADPE